MRWRSPWLLSGGLLLVLILLTIDVLTNGPLVAADHHIRAVVLAHAASPRWLWLSQGRLAPGQLLVNLGNNQVAIPVLAVCALIAVARRQTLRPMLAAAVAVVLLLATVVPAKILIARSGPGLGPVAAAPGRVPFRPHVHVERVLRPGRAAARPGPARPGQGAGGGGRGGGLPPGRPGPGLV